jgi:hypothetical protein
MPTNCGPAWRIGLDLSGIIAFDASGDNQKAASSA